MECATTAATVERGVAWVERGDEPDGSLGGGLVVVTQQHRRPGPAGGRDLDAQVALQLLR